MQKNQFLDKENPGNCKGCRVIRFISNFKTQEATPYNLEDLRDGKEDAWREAFKDDDAIMDD